MEKSELLGSIHSVANNVRMVYLFMLMVTKEVPTEANVFLNNKDKLNENGFSEIKELLNDPRLIHHSMLQLLKSVYKSAFTDIYSMALEYCEQTDQVKKLKSQSFYQFWRIIRNCLSHTYRFEFKKYDLQMLPVSWNGITISDQLQGKTIDTTFFSFSNIWDFFHDVNEFIDNVLA